MELLFPRHSDNERLHVPSNCREDSGETASLSGTPSCEAHCELRAGPDEDLVFFNYFFSDWPQLGPLHHLEYGYNALASLGYSATWNEWVHTQLKVVRFPGSFERWDDITDKR